MKPVTKVEDLLVEINENVKNLGVSDECKYKLKSSNNDEIIITNVPMYLQQNHRLQGYDPSDFVRDDVERYIAFLHGTLDFVQDTFSEYDSSGIEIKPFRLNQCTHNSTGVYHTCMQLENQGNVKFIKSPNIVLGCIRRHVPALSQFNNLLINMENIYIEDWHVWNYVDGMLVDATLFINNETELRFSPCNNWGKASDHVFYNVPKYLEYKGIPYENIEDFNHDINDIFKLQNS
ncbi:MAG: hypothetical protein WC856_21490 [Methylococcaceae bacterium]|jgi:hypothetical protein